MRWKGRKAWLTQEEPGDALPGFGSQPCALKYTLEAVFGLWPSGDGSQGGFMECHHSSQCCHASVHLWESLLLLCVLIFAPYVEL